MTERVVCHREDFIVSYVAVVVVVVVGKNRKRTFVTE
jgi:molybdopterin synthase catalytic subunit